ncbi:MAG: hypothetical protein H6828_12085 [Planctomycetes bacterium]|nr:hypothetical protein [Planctomycetota bacterium]
MDADERDYLGRERPAPGAVPFVSRSSAAPPPPGARVGADGLALPRLRERGTLLLLALTCALQAFSWYQLEGYQLADSVEYMERALALVSDQELQAGGAVRSLAFSTLLVPFFGVAKLVGLQDLHAVVAAVRVFQMGLGLALVLLCTRLGARLGGRQAGWAAGLVCALNPAFLQYSVSPVSGVAAAVGVALGVDLLLERGSRRRAVLGGLALGGAFLMAYQTLLISGALVLLLLLRDRRKHVVNVLAVLGGFLLGILAQVVLDKASYGQWGVSIQNYLIENVLGVVVSALVHLGLTDQQWVRDLYEINLRHMEGAVQSAPTEGDGSLQGLGWYFRELPWMLVPPVMALGVLGLAHAWWRVNWRSSLLLGALALSVAVMSVKGSKSFRLWLPLLPLIAPLCGWGWGWLADALRGRWARLRPVGGLALAAASALLGVRSLLAVNTRRYGVYWEAMDFVNRAVAEDRARVEARGEPWFKVRVCSAYHWAVFGRGSADLGLAKLSEHVDDWDALDDAQHEQLLHELVTSHWLIVHDSIFALHEDLTRALDEHFEVANSFWDADTDPGLRDVKVLRNLSRDPRDPERYAWSGRRLRRPWELVTAPDPAAYRRAQQLEDALPVPQTFVGRGPSGAREELVLLGYDYERLPNEDFGWITYHWYTPTGFERDYAFIDRLTVPDMKSWWRNDHQPGLGFQPTSSWPAGSVLREGFVLIPGEELFEPEYNPIGGDFRRGDRIPATLWLKCRVPMEEAEQELERADAPALHAVAAGSDAPLVFGDAEGLPDDVFESADGHLAMRDGLVRVGELLLFVGPRFAVPDDGRPVRD